MDKTTRSMYLLVKQEATWTDAKHSCISRGAHLVDINNEEENSFLLKTFAGLLVNGKNRGTWIGLNDVMHEGDWRWQDSSTPSFTNWMSGEPSRDASGADRDHVELLLDGWNDTPPNTKRQFMCEKKDGRWCETTE